MQLSQKCNLDFQLTVNVPPGTNTFQGKKIKLNAVLAVSSDVFSRFCLTVISVKANVVQHLLAPPPTRSTSFNRYCLYNKKNSAERGEEIQWHRNLNAH